GLATYRLLMQNMSTRVRPDGGALSAVLEKWVSQIQLSVMNEAGLTSSDPAFPALVEAKILKVINGMDAMVHGFDFAKVMTSYWEGTKSGNQGLKASALKWFRGEYTTKTEAYSELGVRIIIDDETWFDYIKLMSAFVKQIGYSGFIMLVDEGVNLYKISNSINRNNNYEKLLAMFNDTMQGRSAGLGIYMCGTPQFVEDNRRGLFSYEALKSRIASTRFVKNGIRDMQSPLIYLDRITDEEIYVLLLKVLDVHEKHYGYKSAVTEDDLIEFMRAVSRRVGADELLTPREIIRDFIGILNVTKQNPDISFTAMITGNTDLFKTNKSGYTDDDTDDSDGDSAEFTL
ncbi:MAG: ATP-binding protein, partial [Eubacteriales bacterium]|nr:ATP-binding protein [Eubacteriales bacterium]